MRVGIYARGNTLIGQSPEMQLIELREYAARRGKNCVCGRTKNIDRIRKE